MKAAKQTEFGNSENGILIYLPVNRSLMPEGVIKFINHHRTAPPIHADTQELLRWRAIFYATGLIGQDPKRYNGDGYGNLSKRTQKNQFLITASQTSGLETITNEYLVLIPSCNPEHNTVVSEGPHKPSSESMTHATLYQIDADINYVFHAHTPHIWKARQQLHIPRTRQDVEYGTPVMAQEMKRLYPTVRNKKIIAFDGHEDGIITFGRTADEAGLTMLKYLGMAICERI